MNKFIISEEDVEKVSKYQWRKDKQTGYWYTYIKSKKMYLHRFITKNNTSNPTDHINGNKNDNRRENLRICTHKQNARNQRLQSANQTGYRNIFKSGKKYVVQCALNGKIQTLGRYDSILDALTDKVKLWKEKFNIDYTTEYYKATMDIFQIEKDIQDIVLETLEGEII